jgi:hypothetical protein
MTLFPLPLSRLALALLATLILAGCPYAQLKNSLIDEPDDPAQGPALEPLDERLGGFWIWTNPEEVSDAWINDLLKNMAPMARMRAATLAEAAEILQPAAPGKEEPPQPAWTAEKRVWIIETFEDPSAGEALPSAGATPADIVWSPAGLAFGATVGEGRYLHVMGKRMSVCLLAAWELPSENEWRLRAASAEAAREVASRGELTLDDRSGESEAIILSSPAELRACVEKNAATLFPDEEGFRFHFRRATEEEAAQAWREWREKKAAG